MIEDNRVTMIYLYLNYRYALNDQAVQKQSLERLKRSISKLPDYLRVRAEELLKE
ncbi:MAG: hypothetical protein AAF740_00550 [Bacteroidota bacterium]